MVNILSFITISTVIYVVLRAEDEWEKVSCNEDYVPKNCDFQQIPSVTVEDFERCGPALLNRMARNYFLGAAGRRITYNDNKNAYKRYRIVPKMLRNVSESSLEVKTLGQTMSLPVGLSPVALQKLASPLGEIATARAVSNMGTVMIVSSYASTTLEEVAMDTRNRSGHLWMQTYSFRNRSLTEELVSRAEKAGYEAIVVTIDSPVAPKLTCNAREGTIDQGLVNFPQVTDSYDLLAKSQTFKDLSWIRRMTNLPIVAKGVLSAIDAKLAVLYGASAVLVSNHGGRQLDNDPATIDVLPDIVRVLNRMKPPRDVYVDGGIRNGWDVYKAIASGAKMAFIGRPIIWGLAKAGQTGVEDVLNILRSEFEEAMLLAGSSNPSQISKDTVIPARTSC